MLVTRAWSLHGRPDLLSEKVCVTRGPHTEMALAAKAANGWSPVSEWTTVDKRKKRRE